MKHSYIITLVYVDRNGRAWSKTAHVLGEDVELSRTDILVDEFRHIRDEAHDDFRQKTERMKDGE